MRDSSMEIFQRKINELKMSSFLEPVDQTAPVTSICLTIIFSLLFLISSVLNTLFLVIVLRKPSLRNISNRFIISLTISNLFSSWVLLPIAVADMFIKELKPSLISSDVDSWTTMPLSSAFWCSTFNVAADFSTSASVFGTILIGFDRFFAITDPLHYHMLVTRWRSWIFIAFGWILAAFVGSVAGLMKQTGNRWYVCSIGEHYIMDKNPHQNYHYWIHLCYVILTFLFCFAIPFALLSWVYSKIYSAAQQNSERTRRSSLGNVSNLEVVDQSKAISRSSSIRSTSSQLVSNIRRRLSNASLFLYKEEARAAKISIGVIIFFIICWLPFYLIKIIAAVFGEEHIPISLFKFVLVFNLLNAVVSPYVYMYRSKRIQKEVLRLIGISIKSKRKEYERRRPIYHPLPPNMEKNSVSSPCLEIRLKIESCPPSTKSDDGGNIEDNEEKQNLLYDFFRRKLFKKCQPRISDASHSSVSNNSSSYSCPSPCYLPPSILKSTSSLKDAAAQSAPEKSQTFTNLLTVEHSMPERKV